MFGSIFASIVKMRLFLLVVLLVAVPFVTYYFSVRVDHSQNQNQNQIQRQKQNPNQNQYQIPNQNWNQNQNQKIKNQNQNQRQNQNLVPNQNQNRNKYQNQNLEDMDPDAARNKINLLDLNDLSETELKDLIGDLGRIKHSLQTELENIEQVWAEKLKQKLDMDRLINRHRCSRG
jgi:hypothetical protein